MNSKHRNTLEAIFTNPVSTTIEWRRIKALFRALGADVEEGSGSGVTFFLAGHRADFHRPHPGKKAKRYQVQITRIFLEKTGNRP